MATARVIPEPDKAGGEKVPKGLEVGMKVYLWNLTEAQLYQLENGDVLLSEGELREVRWIVRRRRGLTGRLVDGILIDVE